MTDLSEAEIQALQERFHQTPLHALLGLEFVERGDGRSVVRMPMRPEAYGSTGNLHGGAIATLIDVASASAAVRGSAFEPGKNTMVTADLHVRYLARPKGDWVRAEADVERAGRSLVVVSCRVVDDHDRVIALGDFSGMVVPLREPLDPGAATDPEGPEL